jgi:hypothetical protein
MISGKARRRKVKRKRNPAEVEIEELPVRPVSKTYKHRSYVMYGRSGSGKTTLASTFPKPILLLDAKDRGTDSISDVEGIDVMDVKTWDDFETVYWYLKKHPRKYATVVVDTLSQIQQVGIEKVLGDNLDEGRRAGDWGTMRKQDWGNVASAMKIWITNYRDLPMEVCFIAQDRVFNMDDEDESGGLTPEVGPGLMPSVAKYLNAVVTVIGNTFVRQKIKVKGVGKKKREIRTIQYCLRIGPHEIYTTKMRKPRGVDLPPIVIDPSYEDLIEIIQGG